VVQSGLLVRVRGAFAQLPVRLQRQLQGRGIVLGAREAGRVVSQIRSREIIIEERLAHPTPPLDAPAWTGLRERPQMPRPAIPGIGGTCARGELAHDVGAAAGQPVGVGEYHEGARVGGLQGDNALVDGSSNFRNVSVGLDGRDERVRRHAIGQSRESQVQVCDVGGGTILFDDLRERRIDIPR